METRPDSSAGFRRKLYLVIFEAGTPAGRTFDLLLIAGILISVLVVMLDSVPHLRAAHGVLFYQIEWAFTLLFSVEYVLRLWVLERRWRYARSFFGIVDLISILPTYFSLLVPGTQYLLVFRLIRVIRIFRVLRIVPYMGESNLLWEALWNGRRKISIFLLTLVIVAVITGSLMYVVEGEAHGFTSIPLSIYWAVVTMTTVGYGDLSPGTPLGRTLAAMVMIIGYSIIAVPTGIVSVEMARAVQRERRLRQCPRCGLGEHGEGARYCSRCGEVLGEESEAPVSTSAETEAQQRGGE